MVWAVSGPVCPSGHDSRVKQIKAGKQLQLSRSFKPQKTTSEAILLPYPTSTPWFGTLHGETSWVHLQQLVGFAPSLPPCQLTGRPRSWASKYFLGLHWVYTYNILQYDKYRAYMDISYMISHVLTDMHVFLVRTVPTVQHCATIWAAVCRPGLHGSKVEEGFLRLARIGDSEISVSSEKSLILSKYQLCVCWGSDLGLSLERMVEAQQCRTQLLRGPGAYRPWRLAWALLLYATLFEQNYW